MFPEEIEVLWKCSGFALLGRLPLRLSMIPQETSISIKWGVKLFIQLCNNLGQLPLWHQGHDRINDTRCSTIHVHQKVHFSKQVSNEQCNLSKVVISSRRGALSQWSWSFSGSETDREWPGRQMSEEITLCLSTWFSSLTRTSSKLFFLVKIEIVPCEPATLLVVQRKRWRILN